MTRILLTPPQHSFFAKNKYLELEGILEVDQAEELKQRAEEILAKRLKIKPAELASKTSLELLTYGRDPWLEGEKSRKLFLPARLVQIAAALFHHEAMRVALSQYIMPGYDRASPFTHSPLKVRELCSISEVLGAALIKLDEKPLAGSDTCPLPQTIGSALFLAADHTFQPELLFQDPEQSFYLIIFTEQKARYLLNKHDPFTHLLKRSGYAFGDLITDTTHPQLFSKIP